MDDQKERLSASAQKGKRNLLFLGVLAWALAIGWLHLESAETKVGLFGIAASSSVRVVIVGLGLLIAYNLVSFWLHGPFGDWRQEERHAYLLNPKEGPTGGWQEMVERIKKVAGDQSFPEGIQSYDKLEDWLNRKAGRWNSNRDTRRHALQVLWENLSKGTRWKLRVRALHLRHVRLLMIEDLWDLWLPLGVGITGLLAVLIAGFRYWNFID